MSLQARPALGEKIGEGGEGTVYALVSSPGEVAKIYRQPLVGEAAAKLEAMVSAGPGTLAIHAAWPRTLLRGKDGRIDGFIMDRASEPFDIHEVYSPRDRARHLPGSDWGFLVRVAANTAIAFAAAHAAGVVVGDVNHGSVRVGRDGKVRLIDCDSMQFASGDRIYRCAVGIDTYTPPELQAQRLADIDRTPDHDAFGLAVLIFQLLFLGRHPFSGVPVKTGGPTDIAGAIALNGYAYLDPPTLLRPPPAAPPLSLVSEDIRALFLRAFQPASQAAGQPGGSLRPSAREWAAALTALAGGLQTCSQSRAHVYRSGLATCPWCAFEQVGIAVFVGALPARIASLRLDPAALAGLVQRLTSEAARTKRLAAWSGKGAPLAPDRALRLRTLSRLRWFLGLPALLAIIVAGFIGTPWAFFGFVPAIALFLWTNETLFYRRRRRAAKLTGEQRELIARLTNHTYKEAISVAAFMERSQKAVQALLQHAQAPGARPAATPLETQLLAYLDTFRISPGCVHGIGASRIAQLASFGIETAADLDPALVSQVPGFGDQLTERLFKWRRDLEKRYKSNPKFVPPRNPQGLARSGLAPEEERYFAAFSALDVQLRRLITLNDQLEAQRAVLEPKISAVSEELEKLREELRELS
jgi:DNA-binding helix-hairpin-helix protein with protein kinase domain